jgi:hypothetical protein
MDWKETLETTRKQNPSLPYKEQVAKAKAVYDAYKKGMEALKEQAKTNPAAKRVGDATGRSITALTRSTPDLYDAEEQIRKGPIDANKIMSVGRQVMPDGKLTEYGKGPSGVNTLVTFEDEHGNRLPAEGFYEIFIAR